jgi:hypothetical protein
LHNLCGSLALSGVERRPNLFAAMVGPSASPYDWRYVFTRIAALLLKLIATLFYVLGMLSMNRLSEPFGSLFNWLRGTAHYANIHLTEFGHRVILSLLAHSRSFLSHSLKL